MGTSGKKNFACCTTSLIIAETARGVSLISGVIFAANVVQTILESDILILRGGLDEDADALRLMVKYADQIVGFVDCVSFAHMRRNKISKVFGFDRHFAMAGFTLWPNSELKD